MKVGMVGLDNSHCLIFAEILNNREHEYHVPGARIVGAYRGGSDRFSLSRGRIEGYVEELTTRYGITLYETIEQLAEDVDAVFLESTDGRQHLEQFRQMTIGKPVYIDKPFATSAADGRQIIRLSAETGTPIMSCSSLRYAAGISDLGVEREQVIGCEAFGPAPILDDYPGLFWYGVHSAEVLFSMMGTGCQRVRCLPYENMDLMVGEWGDGRLGIVRGTRLKDTNFGCIIHTPTGTRCAIAEAKPPYFFFLLQRVVEFFQTGTSPIDISETYEIAAFLEAANRSREHGGGVRLTESLQVGIG
jgi:hypothetical protein